MSPFLKLESLVAGYRLEGAEYERYFPFGITMIGIILGMLTALFLMILYFRWRTKNPLPEPESVDEILGNTDDQPPKKAGTNPRKSSEPEEDPADWWKRADS